jgi:hypothetical protein
MTTLRCRDRYEMIATSLLYLHSTFELTSMNTCSSVVVRVDVLLQRHKTEEEKESRVTSSKQVLCRAGGRRYRCLRIDSESVL